MNQALKLMTEFPATRNYVIPPTMSSPAEQLAHNTSLPDVADMPQMSNLQTAKDSQLQPAEDVTTHDSQINPAYNRMPNQAATATSDAVGNAPKNNLLQIPNQDARNLPNI